VKNIRIDLGVLHDSGQIAATSVTLQNAYAFN